MRPLTLPRLRLGLLLALLAIGAWTSAQAGFVPSTGSPRVLLILINFSDTTPTYTRDQLYQKLFGTNVGSMADYYRDVSYGQLNLQGDVYGWYTASQPHDYYSPGTYGQYASSYPQNRYRLAEEAVDAAAAAGVDFSLYDNDHDGEAEAVIIIHQGQGAEITGKANDIWTNMVMISSGGGQARTYNGVIVDMVTMGPEKSLANSIVSVGQITHEFGHQLGMPDTYDWDSSSHGVGQYDLMSRGIWGSNPKVYDPDHPAHPSAYQKVLLGWITPTLITPANQGVQTLTAFETNPSVLKVPANPDDSREYFLLSNLTRTGNHAGLPAEGLFVWHVDERALFQNKYECTGCSNLNPLLALEQADGLFDLEKAVNWGDTTDAFPGGGAYRSFTGATTPNSRNHDCHLSGVAVRNISDPGSAMTAEVSVNSFAAGFSAPELKIKSFQVVPVIGSGDGDLHFEAGERFRLILTLVNDGATATGVTATLNPSSSYTVNQAGSSFGNLAPGATAAGSPALDFTLQSGLSNSSRASWSFALRANAGAYSTSPSVTFWIGDPPLLYVDDDGGRSVETYLKNSLDYFRYFYDTWDVARQGSPQSANLYPYSQVLWVTGPKHPDPLSSAEQSAIADYLTADGQLILSSPYLLLQNPSPATIAFARDYLHVASFLDDRFAIEKIRGLNNDPISNSSASFSYNLGLPYFPLYNRTVGLIPGAGAAGSVLNDYGHYTGIRFPEPSTPGPRVIFFSYGVESHYSQNKLWDLLRRCLNALNYQTGEPFIFSISPDRGQLKQMALVLTVNGMNFQPSTTFSFPKGGIAITNSQYVSATQFIITIRIPYNAATDFVPISAKNPAGPGIAVDKYLYVYGPPLAPNQKPLANAGPDQFGYRSDLINLQGSGSDPDYDYPIRYKWTRLQGPAVTLLPSDTAAQPSFVPNPGYAGQYLFSLTVYDALNEPSDADTVAVTIFNHRPLANAGPDQTLYRGATFALEGSGSSDPEGDPLTYQWTQLQGATVALSPGPTARSPGFIPTRPGSYLFSLVVHDPYDLSDADTVRVTVLNHPPSADAGPNQTAEVSQRITLDAHLSSDPDQDPLQYEWTQTQGFPVTLDLTDPVHPYFDPPMIGLYVFSLRVFDGYNWSTNLAEAQAEATAAVNHRPVANAGPDRQGYRAATFQLDGSGSYDPNTDPITFQWTQLQGSTVNLLPGATAAMPTFAPAATYVGPYVFSLQVSDGASLSAADTVQVNVSNHPPVAGAGPDQTGLSNVPNFLDGAASYDAEADPFTYQWTQLEGATVTLSPGDTASSPSFTPPRTGGYLFALVVQDPYDLSAADTVRITIFNSPPVANAGPDQTGEVLLRITFDGSSSSDPDHEPLQFEWTQTQGFPVTLNLSDPVHPYFDPPRVGLYVFRLRVFDGHDWSSNLAQVQADATAQANHAPVAKAGPNRQGYRSDTFLLDGSTSYDPNNDPITFQWTQLQGSTVNLLPGATAAMPTFAPAATYVGSYLFSLQVSDGSSLSAADTVQVNVLNHPPVAGAGPDQTGQVSQIVTLDGRSSADSDHDPLAYLWIQYAGDTVTLDQSIPAQPTFQPPAYGNYLFGLKVNDGFDPSPNQAYTELIITSGSNQIPPVANAGPDQTLSYYNPAPVLLDGSSSYDPDGAITAYAWSFESRPPGSTATLIAPDTAYPSFYHDAAGEYRLSLRVRDNEVWSFKSSTTVAVNPNLDSDGDAIPDSQDPDNDNDQMPDSWEIANGLDPFSSLDGGLTPNLLTDQDGDGIVNVDEFYNESDPHAPNLSCDVAGCFFGDADGSQTFGGPDLDAISLILSGNHPVCSQVFPPNCDTMDLDGSGSFGGPDLDIYSLALSGNSPWLAGFPGPMSLIEPSAPAPVVQVGSTLKIVVESDCLVYGTPRAGLAVVFELISGSGRFYGGDGSTPPRRTLAELSSLNSSAREGVFSISRDGLEIFFASDRPGGLGNLDIYRAARNSVNEPFNGPENVAEVNTAADETGPSISADRLTLYFARYVAGYDYDLFSATRPALDQPFAAPQPISSLNSAGRQLQPMPSDDELRLYFAYYSGANLNLYMAERPSPTSAFNMPPINHLESLNTTASNESFPWISSDELTIIFSSDRPASKAGWNLWMATRTSISNNFGTPVELSHVNTSGHDYDADISADGLTLTVSSTGYGGPGQTDLWQVTRPSTAVPFYVTDNPGRYDITGPIQKDGGQNSSGRAVLRFQPTAPGLVEIVVSSPAAPLRYIPASALHQLIQIQVP
jgi:M6 family metalloprotease-like protein